MKKCYICERSLADGAGEKDHFPTPASLGGECVMDICISCHNDKDRHPLYKWDPDVAYASLIGLWKKATMNERLFLAKLFHIYSQGQHTIETLQKSGGSAAPPSAS